MKVRYIADSQISLSGVTKSGATLHIVFTARTDGRSQYYTDNPEVIYALEHHKLYGRLFKRDALYAAEMKQREQARAKAAKAEQKKEGAAETPAKTKPAAKPVTVKVSDMGQAKDYLARRFEIPRSNLKSKTAIIAAAAERNVTFQGL